MSESYFDDRLITKKHGYSVIVPKERRETMPLYCEVCGSLFLSSDDVVAYEKFKCCMFCADNWAYMNADEWVSGWRPCKRDVEEKLSLRPHKIIKV